jgi:CelD/BcsL family acetyltransferase involved in cellulose biosynthesis/peptidoglycan/xylan/chitin deacetylase (PgdA/CDA1 family)
MKIVEIRLEGELAGFKAQWERLLCDSAANTIFLSWEWITAWWSVYGRTGDLRILGAFDDSGVLRGIAPLRHQMLHRYGQSIPALSFIGDGSNDSDYMDFIVARGYEEAVMASFAEYWAQDAKRGTMLVLNQIPANSQSLELLKRAAERQGLFRTETETACATVLLPGAWDDYLAILKPRFRTKVRSVLRNLENLPSVRFGFCDNAEQVERMLPILFDLHTRRWAQEAKPGVFGWEAKRKFYAALSPLLLARDWLRLSWLEWNGRILACQYGFTYDGVYSQLQEGYEPAAEHWNIGAGLRAWSIREYIKRGVREYDFLSGSERHKLDWGASTKGTKSIAAAQPGLQTLLYCRGPEWEEKARETAKRVLPQKIMTIRHERLERQRLAALQKTQNGHCAESPGGEFVRKAVAHCYAHLGFPALVRPLRDRYQLSVTSNGHGRKISWNRRTEAAARILFYHRVNDDRDPFFPSIGKDLFERQIRHVARHHKVVSMTDLLNHLETGSPGMVVAITFDDGYRDNYENAFPILQRYGLPATIFLATEVLDTRDLLWFDQLAYAIKKTSNEFIDLEIDIPRRFWMRTQAERLEANGRIFAMLRSLPDGDRRRWFEDIRRRLAVPDLGELRDKMLTWDQVRHMKRNRIDFGGHTVTHPFLSKMTPGKAAWEMSECRRRIEAELQLPIDCFAYPSGREEDFNEWNQDLVREAGYRAAVTTIWGINDHATDPMELKRGGPWEASAGVFAYKLDWYQLVNG